MDEAEELKTRVVLGFTRDGTHLVSYAPPTDDGGAFSLQLWAVGPRGPCRKLWSVSMFTPPDSPFEADWRDYVIAVFETGDSSLLLAHAYSRAETAHPSATSYVCGLPGPAAPRRRPVRAAALQVLSETRRGVATGTGDLHNFLNFFEVPGAPGRPATVAAALFTGTQLSFVHLALGAPAGEAGWVTAGGAAAAGPAEVEAWREEVEEARERLGWRACWRATAAGGSAAATAPGPWLDPAEGDAVYGLEFVESEWDASGGGGAGEPLGVAVRMPALCFDVDAAVQAVLEQRRYSLSQLGDYWASTTVELADGSVARCGTPPARWRSAPLPAASLDLGEEGVLAFLHLSMRIRLGVSMNLTLQVPVHVPARTGRAHLVSSRGPPWVRAAAAAGTDRRWHPEMPFAVDNAWMATTGTSMVEIRHPWLPLALRRRRPPAPTDFD